MGTYDHGFILDIWKRFPGHEAHVAVETGTCLGNSTRRLARLYREVHTVELSSDLSRRTAEAMRAEGLGNVTFHVGDSKEVLPEILGRIKEPCLFFLDAHWSGDSTVEWTAAWRGYGVDTAHLGPSGRAPASEEQVPLLSEVCAISEHFAPPATLCIDDFLMFDAAGSGRKDVGWKGNDWSHLHTDDLKAACTPRLLDWVAADGQLAVVLRGM